MVQFLCSFPANFAAAKTGAISLSFCRSIHARQRHDRSMATPPSTPTDSFSLRLRRVQYQTGPAAWGEGVVTQHDPDTGMVTVLDTGDGSFWRGSEDRVEIVA